MTPRRHTQPRKDPPGSSDGSDFRSCRTCSPSAGSGYRPLRPTSPSRTRSPSAGPSGRRSVGSRTGSGRHPIPTAARAAPGHAGSAPVPRGRPLRPARWRLRGCGWGSRPRSTGTTDPSGCWGLCSRQRTGTPGQRRRRSFAGYRPYPRSSSAPAGPDRRRRSRSCARMRRC